MSHARRLVSSSLSWPWSSPATPAPRRALAPLARRARPSAPPRLSSPSSPTPSPRSPRSTDPPACAPRTWPKGHSSAPAPSSAPVRPLVVPPGTLAELRLTGGTVLRLNEDSRLTLPDGPRPRRSSSCRRARRDRRRRSTAAGGPVGDDTLDIASGEARAFARAGRRSYDVVYGTARLRSRQPGGRADPGLARRDPAGPRPSPSSPRSACARSRTPRGRGPSRSRPRWPTRSRRASAA
jgi:hypothetical protein